MTDTTQIEGILADTGQAFTQGDALRAWQTLSPLLEQIAQAPQELSAPHVYQAASLAAQLAITLGDAEKAAPWAELAVDLSQRQPWAVHLLAVVRREQGRAFEALELWREVVAGPERILGAYQGLATLLTRCGDEAEACTVWEQALALWPQQAELWQSYGLALCAGSRWSEAEQAFRTACQWRPHWDEPLSNLGWVLRRQGRFREALVVQQQAVAANPQSSSAWWNVATSLLSLGEYRDGFTAFEWRLKRGRSLLQQRALPQWMGTDSLNGKRLLVAHEQGLGDAIQMLRFAQPLAARGAEVLWECPASIETLVANTPGVTRAVSLGAVLMPSEGDVQCPAMSLPFLLGAFHREDLCAEPYLKAPAGEAPPLNSAEGRKRVGLVWRGNPSHEGDAARSIPFVLLEPLLAAALPIQWVCLQHHTNRPDLSEAALTRCFEDDLGIWPQDFGDTARVITALDLVISVDTAVLHLAAAMGRPTWGLLPLASDWRWLVEEELSPWYPSLRLFRQTETAAQACDASRAWLPVLDRVRAALAAWV